MTTQPAPSPTDPFTHRLTRRGALSALAGLGALALAACSKDSAATATTATTADTASSTAPAATAGTTETTRTTAATASAESTATTVTENYGTCPTPPEETAGPFPADGSNDNGDGEEANVLDDAAAIRSDITGSLDGSGVQPGVPLTLNVTVADAGTGCVPMPGAAVYIWHANRDGAYSVYNVGMNPGHAGDSFLRGVQIADANGKVSFSTILPGRYQGRASHVHFAVFSDDTFTNRLLTSQMAFDDDQMDSLYAAADGYSGSVGGVHNAQDNVFSDGIDEQMLTLAGDVNNGLVGTIVIGV